MNLAELLLALREGGAPLEVDRPAAPMTLQQIINGAKVANRRAPARPPQPMPMLGGTRG